MTTLPIPIHPGLPTLKVALAFAIASSFAHPTGISLGSEFEFQRRIRGIRWRFSAPRKMGPQDTRIERLAGSNILTEQFPAVSQTPSLGSERPRN